MSIPKIAKGKDEIMYIHVTDKDNKLLGVIDVKELLQADNKALLKDIMNKNVITSEEGEQYWRSHENVLQIRLQIASRDR